MVKIFDLLANKNNYGSTRVLDNIKYIVIHEAKDDNINSVNDYIIIKNVNDYIIIKKSVATMRHFVSRIRSKENYCFLQE